MIKFSLTLMPRVISFSWLKLWIATFVCIHGISLAQSVNLDNLSFFKAPPLELTVEGKGEQFDITIKNVSPVTLVLSNRSLSKMDVLWLIKLNGQRQTSGVRGEVTGDGHDLQQGVNMADQILLAEIKKSKDFTLMSPGETISFPIPKESFIASGIISVANSISEKNPLDVTVALSNPIAGFIDKGDRLSAIQGQLTFFSTPVKLSRIPSLK